MKYFVLFLLFVVPALAAVTSPEAPYNLLFTDAEVRQAFFAGMSLQSGFEMTGFLVRMLRNLRASGTVDLGG